MRVENVSSAPTLIFLVLVLLFIFFLPISGKVLVPTHLFHLGGNHNCYIHSWLTDYPH